MTTNSMRTQSENVVLAHDAFTQYGGAERVFDGAQEIWPKSSIYTLVIDKNYPQDLSNWNLKVSPLQKLYSIYPRLTHLFAFIPFVFEIWKPKTGKVLLSFSSSFIKALHKPKGAVHINYCHTPTRFLWIDPEHALKEIWWPLHPLAKIYWYFLRKWDLSAAKNIDYFIANSKEVQTRIRDVYKKDSEIIYPFIDINFWKPTSQKSDYFLIAGRLQYAKGLDIVIKAFNQLGLPLHVVGTGRYESALKEMAKPNIKFLGRVTDQQLRDEYSGAKAFIYPQFEDFGLMPLEAAACGTASIGLAKGGSLETIIQGQTGQLLNHIDISSLIDTVQKWDEKRYSTENCQTHARKFSKENFQQQLKSFVETHGTNRN